MLEGEAQTTEEAAASRSAEIRRKAMDLLARREHAREELALKLLQRGFDSEDTALELDRLAEEGLQSDARFAENYAQSCAGRGKGPDFIRNALRERRVDDGLIHAAVKGVACDWRAAARAARHKRFGPAQPEDYAQRAKQMRFLHGRGFTHEQIEASFAED